MNRLPLFLLFLVMISCKTEKVEYVDNIAIIFHEEDGPSIYLGEDRFAGQYGRELNDEGIALAKEKEFEKAKEKFLAGLESEPENPILLNNIGNTEHKLKNYYKAIYYFEKSLEASDSTYLNACFNLGVLYWKDYEFQKSAQVLEIILSKSNNDFEKALAHLQLARTYLDQNRCDKSQESYLKAESGLQTISGFDKTLQYLKEEINNCVQHRL